MRQKKGENIAATINCFLFTRKNNCIIFLCPELIIFVFICGVFFIKQIEQLVKCVYKNNKEKIFKTLIDC